MAPNRRRRRCPVIDTCLTWALEQGEDREGSGVWGGFVGGRAPRDAAPCRPRACPQRLLIRTFHGRPPA
ncbi:WhiB family transcriptional regulator [Streptomyces sp. NPDC020799]|uniref:WhiB family transcriptional regulator n=1 Tax=Streptomyces sp. NPDC020799 TaxID=3365091 RepID=UPI00378E0197